DLLAEAEHAGAGELASSAAERAQEERRRGQALRAGGAHDVHAVIGRGFEEVAEGRLVVVLHEGAFVQGAIREEGRRRGRAKERRFRIVERGFHCRGRRRECPGLRRDRSLARGWHERGACRLPFASPRSRSCRRGKAASWKSAAATSPSSIVTGRSTPRRRRTSSGARPTPATEIGRASCM